MLSEAIGWKEWSIIEQEDLVLKDGLSSEDNLVQSTHSINII